MQQQSHKLTIRIIKTPTRFDRIGHHQGSVFETCVSTKVHKVYHNFKNEL